MTFERKMRRPYDPATDGHPGTRERSIIQDGMRIDYDVRVELRDGVGMRINVYRPDTDDPVPVIFGWGGYGKHRLPADWFPGSGVDPEWISDHTIFEAPDPIYWTGHGYAVVNVDPRGTWYSEGDHRGYASVHEGDDAYDLIEWAGTQPWSNGKVGMSGVSYFAIIQWFAAAARPPHLAAISPWEGFTDRYREAAYHGGMLETGLMDLWWHDHGPGFSSTTTEDGWRMMVEHPLFDEYWAEFASQVEQIDVPAFVVASWADQGLHTRGTLEGFKRMGSADKWLMVHGRKKWESQYRPDHVERLRAFFDQFLKGVDRGVYEWPRVQLEIRERCYVGEIRAEDEWPIARTDYTRLYLDAASMSMSAEVAPEEHSVDYLARGAFPLVFDHRFETETELTGHSALRLWIAALDSDDADVFVALEKLDVDGNRIGFPFFAVNLDGPSALGWLRVSHRALDAERSTEYQPWHPHDRVEKVSPGEAVPIDIEIWPSSVLFRAGETLRLVVSGRDIDHYDLVPGGPKLEHAATVNVGQHRVLTGGAFQSYLTVPVIPPKLG